MDLSIIKEFFENPDKSFHIRELSRKLDKNHMTVRKKLIELKQEQYLKKEKTNLYETYKANKNKKFYNLKLYYNLEKIRKSKIIDKINEEYDYPQIILFGSYSEAKDDENSDIDICLITNVKKEIELKKFKTKLNKNVDLRIFSEKEWEKLIKNNASLANNIIRGITLSDEFEAIR